MENEIEHILQSQEIMVTQGKVIFTDYESIKEEAIQLSEHIKTIQVNEENVKQSKKLIAAINKRVKEFDDRRITIKKLILHPYDQFADKVNEIVGIVRAADEIVKQQIKDLEEGERADKEFILYSLFQRRMASYSFKDLFDFEHWLQPKHLNKTTSIANAEKDMVDFLEGIAADLEVIEKLDNGKDVLQFYIDTKDLSAAMKLVQKQDERKRHIEQSQALEIDKGANIFYFKVYHEKDFKLIEMFMKNNNIDFEYNIKGEI
jgi:hypothetical protein